MDVTRHHYLCVGMVLVCSRPPFRIAANIAQIHLALCLQVLGNFVHRTIQGQQEVLPRCQPFL